MTPNSIEVFERLGGWTQQFKYEQTLARPYDYTSVDGEGVMWVHNDHGAKVRRLEHMELDGKTYVREPV